MQVFPHHENEIAQSRAACCGGDPTDGEDRFARFWLHNGFVKINDEKMYARFTALDYIGSPPESHGSHLRIVVFTQVHEWPLIGRAVAQLRSHCMLGYAM